MVDGNIFDRITDEGDRLTNLSRKQIRQASKEEQSLNLSDPDFLNKVAGGKWTLFCLRHGFTLFSIVITLSIVSAVAIRMIHLLAPESWAWLTFSQLSDLDKLITFVAIGLTARYFPTGKFRKEDKDDGGLGP